MAKGSGTWGAGRGPGSGAAGGVALEEFLPDGLEPLAGAAAPLPFLLGPGRLRLLPSPRLTEALLGLLELRPGLRVLFLGGLGGYAEALAARIAGDVVVVDADPAVRRVMALNLGAGGHPVAVLEAPPGGRWDRVFASSPAAGGRRWLADGGILLERRSHRLVRTVAQGGEFLEIAVERLGGSAGLDLHALLAAEELLGNAWGEAGGSPLDRHFREVVETTFAPDYLEVDEGWEARWLALKAFHLAYIHQALGHLREAQDLYRRSLRLHPTAEAHTFLGWTLSFEGRLEEAMEECRRAIAVDPSLGNPYNDLGAYLLERGRAEEAIPWLERALAAPRYSCYYYAHCNLGRALLLLGRYGEARGHLEAALRLNPDYEVARLYLEELDRLLGPPGGRWPAGEKL